MKPERLSRNVVYQSPWVNLYLDNIKFPNGLVIEKFHLLDFSYTAVAAVVEDDLFVSIAIPPALQIGSCPQEG